MDLMLYDPACDGAAPRRRARPLPFRAGLGVRGWLRALGRWAEAG